MSRAHRYRDIQQSSFSNLYRHFTYVTNHSPTLPSHYLRHSSFSNPFVASPTSQFILQLFFRFSYVTSSSLNSPGEPPMREQQGFRPTTPVVPSYELIKLNATKNEMSVKKWQEEKGRNIREKPTQIPFRLPRNPHGVTQTRTRDPKRWKARD